MARVSEASYLRLWALGLAALSVLAAVLIAQVNPLEGALVSLAALVAVVVVGLLTNVWGGLLAGALGASTMLWITHNAGALQPGALASTAGALAAVLLAGPLAGGVSRAIERTRHEADRWLGCAEETAIHDEILGVLKPEWARIRLEEEAVRAAHFGRPLTVALLQLTPRSLASRRAERLAALQAVLRVARAALPPAAVVAHAGAGQVLLILPEHTLEQGQLLVEQVCRQSAAGHYFPPQEATPLGQPMRDYGDLGAGLIALDGHPETADELLARARAAIAEPPCLN